jgi:hypothetical protein
MMNVRDRIEDLEQQMFVACSEGNFAAMDMLEQKLENLRGRSEPIFQDDPYAIEGRFLDDDR